MHYGVNKSLSVFQMERSETIDMKKMEKYDFLIHFCQQDIEPINEAAVQLRIHHIEFIRRARRSLINKMNDAPLVQRFSSPSVN